MAAEATTTTDHDTIRQWTEERGGKPAAVKGTGENNDDPGLLRIEFPDSGNDDSDLTELSWDEFFAKFDASNLAFLYQDETADGNTSRFFKFVAR